MRFKRDSFTVSTWETDLHGIKIAGSEHRHTAKHTMGSGSNEVWRALWHAIDNRTPNVRRGRWVIGEAWAVDSRRPDTKLYFREKKEGELR